MARMAGISTYTLMGKYMLIGFKVWLKESGITNNNALTELGSHLKGLGSDSPLTWSINIICRRNGTGVSSFIENAFPVRIQGWLCCAYGV